MVNDKTREERYKKVISPTKDDVFRKKVIAALADFINLDIYLLQRDVNERSITHKLAEHLQRQFPEWNVDCEYNRDMDNPKRLRIKKIEITSDDTEGRTTYPDIIVHKRGNNDNNKLVIEVKKNRSVSCKDKTVDINKVKAFTSSKEFKYERGLFLLLPVEGNDAKLSWYRNGEMYCKETICLEAMSNG